MTHTPGPWNLTTTEFAGGPATEVEGICIVFGHGKTPDANARLIAAAPELLAVVLELADTPGPLGIRCKARTAIANASKREPPA